MTGLRKCEANNTSCDKPLRKELEDIYAYHQWLTNHAKKAPFATTVIIHNLVTDSISRKHGKWLREKKDKRPRHACVKDAAKSAARFLGLKEGKFKPAMPQPDPPLPGIGKHRVIDCT